MGRDADDDLVAVTAVWGTMSEQHNEARAHLQHAHDFLDGARANLALGNLRAASSDAVLAGIRAKDAMSTALTGSTRKSDDHRSAVKELSTALGKRPETPAAERALTELVKFKTPIQYSTQRIEETRVTGLVRRAESLVELADEIVTQG